MSTAVAIEPCWNQIGVWGRNDCPELQRHVHCRNCAVYSNAGLALLNRPLPDHYRRDWTAHYALEERFRAPPKRSAIFFRIDSEWLALPTQTFQEVAQSRPIHSLPHRRGSLVLGLANIRGELLICIALGQLLGLEKSAFRGPPTRIKDRLLVVDWEGQRLAFPVNEVQGIQRFQPEELVAPPATLAKSVPCFIQGLLYSQQRAVGLLDAPLLFSALNQSLA